MSFLERNAQTQDNLLGFRDRIKATIVFVSHDIGEAILLSDRVPIMSAGPGRIPRDLPVALPRPRSSADGCRLPRLEKDCLDPIRAEGRKAFEQMGPAT